MKKFFFVKSNSWIFISQCFWIYFCSLVSWNKIGPIGFADSFTYVSEPPKLDGYFSLSGYSWRSWPTVGLYYIFESYSQRTLAQALIYATAWSFLIYVVSLNKSNFQKLLTGGLFAVLATSPIAIQWNNAILAESLTISLLILGVSFSIYSCMFSQLNYIKTFLIFLSIIMFSLAAVNRISLIPFLIIPLIQILMSFYRGNRIRSSILLLINIAFTFYPFQYNANSNEYWKDEVYGITRSSLNFMYFSATNGVAPDWSDKTWNFVTKGAPECMQGLRGTWDPKYEVIGPLSQVWKMPRECPEAVTFLNENFDPLYLKFVLNNAQLNIQHIVNLSGTLVQDTNYLYLELLPKSISVIFNQYEDSHYPQTSPVYFWSIVGIFSTVITMGFSKPFFQAKNLDFIFALFFIASFMSIGLSILMINTELIRITSPATVLMFISCICLFTSFLDKTKEVFRVKSQSSFGKANFNDI